MDIAQSITARAKLGLHDQPHSLSGIRVPNFLGSSNFPGQLGSLPTFRHAAAVLVSMQSEHAAVQVGRGLEVLSLATPCDHTDEPFVLRTQLAALSI